MADNVAITAGSGTSIATDDVGGVHYQYVKLANGTLDSSTPIPADSAKGLYVDPRGSTKKILTTPTISSGAIYAAKDAIGGIMSWAAAARVSGEGGVIQSVTIWDKGQQMAAMDLVLFAATIGGTVTDNSAFDPTDVMSADFVGSVSFVGADYIDFSDNSVAFRGGLGIPYTCNDTTLYGALVSRGTPTYTSTSDLNVVLGLLLS